MAKWTWDKWLRAWRQVPLSPTRMPGSFGAMTGQDARLSMAVVFNLQLRGGFRNGIIAVAAKGGVPC